MTHSVREVAEEGDVAHPMFSDEGPRMGRPDQRQRRVPTPRAAGSGRSCPVQADPSLEIPGRERAIYLDSYRGECRDSGAASKEDVESAPFAIRADAYAWKQVLDGKLGADHGAHARQAEADEGVDGDARRPRARGEGARAREVETELHRG